MQARRTLLSLVRAHPYRTAIHTTNGAIFLEPRIVTVPLFWALGFEGKGPRKDSTASAWMRVRDRSSTQTVYSIVQSAAMSGSGVDTVGVAVKAVAAVLSVAMWCRGRR